MASTTNAVTAPDSTYFTPRIARHARRDVFNPYRIFSIIN